MDAGNSIRLLTASGDCQVKMWDVQSGEPLMTYAHSGYVVGRKREEYVIGRKREGGREGGAKDHRRERRWWEGRRRRRRSGRWSRRRKRRSCRRWMLVYMIQPSPPVSTGCVTRPCLPRLGS